MGYITRSRYFKYHVKPILNNILIIISILIVIVLLSILIINSIKKELVKCDNELEHTCTIYELHNYNRN